MKILIPRVTDITTRKDLREFANRVLQKWIRWPFTEHAIIRHCEIISIPNSMGVVQRHGLLDVTPDDAAFRIIRRLNGAFLRGKRVGVKQYSNAVAREIAGY